MKKVLLVIFMLFITCGFTIAQELSEPTDPPLEYKAEISWGSTNSTWAAIPITYTVVDGTPGIHKYWTFGLGIKLFEAVALESTVTTPKKVTVTMNIASFPATGNKWWGNFFRTRIYGSITTSGQTVDSTKSEASYWVGIISLPTPQRPIGQ
jgi:hypothetical protein